MTCSAMTSLSVLCGPDNMHIFHIDKTRYHYTGVNQQMNKYAIAVHIILLLIIAIMLLIY